MDMYSLTKKMSYYKNMRENVVNMINILSNSSINSNLSVAMSSMKENYNVNNEACKYNEISNIKNTIASDINNLKNILYHINIAIQDLEQDIGRIQE